MMSIFGSLLLTLIGALSITEELSKYRPSLRLWLEGLSPFRGYLGLGCASYGLISTLNTLSQIGVIRYIPFVYLSTLAAGIVAICAGILLGYETASQFLQNKIPEEQWAKVESCYFQLLAQQKNLGYAALALGVFQILLNLIVPEAFFWKIPLWG